MRIEDAVTCVPEVEAIRYSENRSAFFGRCKAKEDRLQARRRCQLHIDEIQASTARARQTAVDAIIVGYLKSRDSETLDRGWLSTELELYSSAAAELELYSAAVKKLSALDAEALTADIQGGIELLFGNAHLVDGLLHVHERRIAESARAAVQAAGGQLTIQRGPLAIALQEFSGRVVRAASGIRKDLQEIQTRVAESQRLTRLESLFGQLRAELASLEDQFEEQFSSKGNAA